MNAQERLNDALKAVDAAHAAHAAQAAKEREAFVAVRTQQNHFASESTIVDEVQLDVERRALVGENVSKELAAIAEKRSAIAYFLERVLPKLEAFSLKPLAEETARLLYERERAVLHAEQCRLAAHEQTVARALRELCNVCGNPALTAGGGDNPDARNSGDLKGARFRDIIADQLGATDRARRAWHEAQQRTIQLQRAYLEKFGNG